MNLIITLAPLLYVIKLLEYYSEVKITPVACIINIATLIKSGFTITRQALIFTAYLTIVIIATLAKAKATLLEV